MNQTLLEESKSRSTPNSLLLTLVFLLFAGAGCDAFDLDTTRLVVGTVFEHPRIADGNVFREQLTEARVFFGEREPGLDVFDLAPVGIVGADVNLAIFSQGDGGSVQDIALIGQGDGMYGTDSLQNPNLLYQPGASYRVEVEEFGDLYEVDLEQAPHLEGPQGLNDGHPYGEPLLVTRSQLRIAFVDVYLLSGNQARVTYSTTPVSVQDILEVVSDPSPYQRPEMEIPGQAFSEPGTYAVVLTTAARAVPDFNLYSGSGVLVGSGEARLFRVD